MNRSFPWLTLTLFVVTSAGTAAMSLRLPLHGAQVEGAIVPGLFVGAALGGAALLEDRAA
jgi:hypothetical protein